MAVQQPDQLGAQDRHGIWLLCDVAPELGQQRPQHLRFPRQALQEVQDLQLVVSSVQLIAHLPSFEGSFALPRSKETARTRQLRLKVFALDG